MKTVFAIFLLVTTPAFADKSDWDSNKSVHENVLAMEYKLQMLTLAFLVTESGRSCQPVLHRYQGGTESGDHYWTIGCLNGTRWSVMLADDGYQVMSCTMWEKISERSCLASF